MADPGTWEAMAGQDSREAMAGNISTGEGGTFFYILYCVLYILFFTYFIYVYFLCVVFYNICTVHGADLTHISLLVIYSLYNNVCDK